MTFTPNKFAAIAAANVSYLSPKTIKKSDLNSSNAFETFSNCLWVTAGFTSTKLRGSVTLILVCIFSFIYILRIPVFFDTFKFYDPSWLNWKEQVEERNTLEASLVKVFPQWKNFPSWELFLPPLINK